MATPEEQFNEDILTAQMSNPDMPAVDDDLAAHNAKVQASFESGASQEEISAVSEGAGVPLVQEESTDIPSSGFYDTEEPQVSDAIKAEQSVTGALAQNSLDPIKDFKVIRDELSLFGESPTYQEIAQALRQDASIQLSGSIEDTAALGNVAELKLLVVAAPQLVDETANVRKTALTNASHNQVARDPSIRGAEYQQWYQDGFFERDRAREAVNKILNTAVADSTTSTAAIGASLVELGTVQEQVFLGRAAREILGEHYFFMGGDMARDLADHIMAGRSQEEQVARAMKVAEAIDSAAGVFGNNDITKVFALETVRDFINLPDTETNVLRYVANVIGVVEAIPFIGVAGRVAKRLVNTRRTAESSGRDSRIIDDVTEADPELGSTLNVAAIKDPDTAKSLGTTQEDAIKRTLPHGQFEPNLHLEGAPQQLIDDINLRQTRADEIDDYIENTYLFSDETYKASERKASDILRSDEVVGTVKPSSSSMARVGNRIRMQVVYGADETNYPIESLERAVELKNNLQEAFEGAFKADVGAKTSVTPSARIIVKDGATGAYGLPTDTVVRTKPRYYVSIDQDIPMQYSDIVPGPQDVTKSVSKAGKLLTPPNTFISRNVVGAAVISNEKKGFVKSQLRDIARPFLTLNAFAKRDVAKVLLDGEEAGRVYNFTELQNKGLNNRQIEAYFSTRQFNETVYRIKNNDMHETLKVDGFKSIAVRMDDAEENIYQNAGKPLELDQVTGIKTAYDVKLGKGVSLEGNQAAKVYDSGRKVVRVRTKLQSKEGDFEHIVVRGDDISELPSNVMPYRVGYNFRINNDPYFVTSKSRGKLDGVNTDINKTLGVAKNSKQAQKWVDELRIANPKVEYGFRLDRNISSTESLLKQQYDLLDGSGPQFWYSKRGERLARQDSTLSAVEDPATAIERLSVSVANVSTHKQMFDAAAVNHQKKYGSIEVNGRKLWEYSPTMKQSSYIGKQFDEAVNPEIRAANREYEYLEGLRDIPTGADVFWRDMMLQLDRSFLGKTELSSATILASAKINPAAMLRNTTFTLSLAVRPVKQLFLQWSTGMQMMGVDPGSTLRAMKNSALMNYSMAFEVGSKNWNRYVAPAAKALGQNPKEWEKIFTEFRRSGKGHSIDSNSVVGEANYGWSRAIADNMLGEGVRTAKNVMLLPINLSKKIGFDLGELGNQSVSWLFARDRWIKANPGKKWDGSQRALDEISVLARNLSVDMTKTNILPYQRGGFATMTQFMSINNKMAFRIAGVDPDVPVGTMTHAKYIGGMAVMYGAAGFGLQDFYQQWKLKEGIEIPEEIDDIYYGGITQYLFNKSLGLAFDQDVNTSFSKTFSPASGIPTGLIASSIYNHTAPEFVSEMFEGSFVEAMLGPSGSTFQRIGRAASHVALITGRKDYDTADKIIEGGMAALNEFGSFSDVFNFNLAMSYKEKMDSFNLVNRKGLIGPRTNEGELWAKMLLGLQTESEGEFYNVILKLNSEVSAGKADSQIRDDAKQLSEWWWRNYLANENDEASFEKAVMPIMNALNNGGDRLYNDQVWRQARTMIRLKPGFDSFISNIAKNHQIFDPEADMDEMRNITNVTSLLNDEEKENVLRNLDIIETSVNNSREILDELGDF